MEMYIVETAYLQEEDAFGANQLVEDWAPASNVFIKRAAANTKAGAQGSLSLDEFVQWVGEFARSLPQHSGSALDLEFAAGSSGMQVGYQVGERIPEIASPIEADNPGFLRYALDWCSSRRDRIRIYVTAGLFWVEKLS